jgi:Mg-chelatase subunit ChlD
MRAATTILLSFIVIALLQPTVARAQLSSPESVAYWGGEYYVSNAGNGRITKQNGATVFAGLTQPKGMAMRFSAIHVADVTVVRAYDLNSYASLFSVTIPGAQSLNDIALDADGNIFVSDMQANKIFKIHNSTHFVTTIASAGITSPNGIWVDGPNRRLIVVSFRANSPIQAVDTATGNVTTLATTSLSNLDGITADAYGNFYISSWGSGSIYHYNGTFTDGPHLVASGYDGPADIFFNSSGNTLAIPVMNSNSLQFVNLAVSITTSVIAGTSFNAGDPVTVPFTVTGTFWPGNIFTAQLSDASGSFNNPTSIGSLTGTSSGSISCTIPASASTGFQYRIRVISSAPICAGLQSNTTLSVYGNNPLTFNRIVNNWPTIECYFTVTCNKQVTGVYNKSLFKVMEDSVEVPSFDLWCPDSNMRCARSISLVFDASGSMGGAGNAGAKAAGNAFVDLLDPTMDEAAVIWFNTMVTVQQGMTNSQDLLHAAVNALPASGGTAVWDGAYFGLLELINNGVNQCRAVILLTDGEDNSSSRGISEIISLANRNRVRVFTIGLGGPINSAQLEAIATLTGGRYYEVSNASQLTAIYQEISTILLQGFKECLITYQATCMDGATRKVELVLNNFCGTSDTKSKLFRALRDTTTFTPVRIKLDTMTVQKNTAFSLPLMILDAPGRMKPGTITILYDNAQFAYQSIVTNTYLLNGIPVTVTPISGGITVRIDGSPLIQQSGVLAMLRFLAPNVNQSSQFEFRLQSVQFDAGCLMPRLESGQVRIEGNPLPSITANGPLSFCDGGSVTLTAQDGFISYTWSTGEKTKSIVVTKSGTYTVTVVDAQSRTGTSQPVAITVWPIPTPAITPPGPVTICPGKSIDLDAGPGFVEYTWSTGAKTRMLTVTTAGDYTVAVRDANGCVGSSQKVTVTVAPLTVTVTVDGPTTFCEGGSVRLDAGAGYASYRWSTGETTRFIVVRQSGVYACTATDASGCSGLSQPVPVTVQAAPTALLTVIGSTTLCEGDSVILDAGAGFVFYQWSTGASTQRITVRLAGAYYAIVENAAGCRDTSNLVTITILQRPAKPAITRNANTLAITVQGRSYQWSMNGSAIPGEVNQYLFLTQIGTYTVTVTGENGCSSTSDPFLVDKLLGIENPAEAGGFDLFPDPNEGVFVVSLRTERPGSVELTVVNTLGQIVEQFRSEHAEGAFRREIRLGGRPSGMYIVHVRAEGLNLFRKMYKR